MELHDAAGAFLARPDLLYPRDRVVADNRRRNRLQRAGHTLLGYTAPDVHGRAPAILDEVRAQLRCA